MNEKEIARRNQVIHRNFQIVQEEEYIANVIGEGWWSNTPLHRLRTDDHLGHMYPTADMHHFSESINTSDSIRWTYGDRWYEEFTKPRSPQDRLPGLIHRVNSDNWNGPEFETNPSVLALGCSVTSGIGMNDNFIWPSLVRHMTRNTINNIGIPGASPSQCVYTAFSHIRKYGNPGNIMFLVPPLDRYWGPRETKIDDGTIRDKIWPVTGIHYFPELQYYIDHQGTVGSQKPYKHQSIDGNKTQIPVDVVAHHNLMMIETLMMYCEANEIGFRMSSWCPRTHMHLKLIGYENLAGIPDFLRRDQRQHQEFLFDEDEHNEWGAPHEMSPMGSRKNCCDRAPQNKWQDRFWDHGLDIKHDRFYPHPGMHYHLHLAELFLGRQIGNDDLAEITAWHEGTDLEPTD